MDKNSVGLIHAYYGDGKGKTTAAIGLAARAAGRGRRVAFVQFLKGRKTGEIASLGKLGVNILRSEKIKLFSWEMSEEQRTECRAIQTELLEKATGFLLNGDLPDLLILDEVLNAISADLLDEKKLREFVIKKPEDLEIVLTGRSLPEWLAEASDYITEMKKHKHPFDRGMDARESIEF